MIIHNTGLNRNTFHISEYFLEELMKQRMQILMRSMSCHRVYPNLYPYMFMTVTISLLIINIYKV